MWRDGSKSSRASVIRNTKHWARYKKKTEVSWHMTLTLILFGSNMGLRALNKNFLYRLLSFFYFDDRNCLKFNQFRELHFFSVSEGTPCTFTFSGKKILHLQENLSFASKSCICKKIFLLQENLAFAGLLKLRCTWARKCYICKKNLAFTRKSCVCKKILPKQEICAFATKSCKSKNIFPLNVKVLY